MATFRDRSFIRGQIPRYKKLYEGERWKPGPEDDWNPDLPYGGKVYLARKRKTQSWLATILEGLFVVAVICFIAYAYYYMEHLHLHALKLVAHTVGSSNAQNYLGQRYLNGNGVKKDVKVAMHYFRQSAEQGHPHGSHNAAVGHLRDHHHLPPGHAEKYFRHAAAHGILEAHDALLNICADGGCE